ncbi:MAG: tautomerase [Paraburkholderia sp.]|uniref:tautomerase n=1 Tax=Burkholderiaceae TaxID=119060 RepID=UPI0010F5D003|nr:tautomerase [Burkholderia sp. 4M9327F10]
MPNILVKIPKDSFPVQHREALVRLLNNAAASAEQIPDDAKKRFLCWVVVDEVAPGLWTCGGIDVTAQVLPCIAMIYLPAGVLDAAARARYVSLAHEAFRQALPAADQRQLVTSVIVHDVMEGTWGANGAIWRLPDFAAAAGFAHLKSLGYTV